VNWYRLSGKLRGRKNAHMANCNRLADDMRGFWCEEGLRASHEKRIMRSQVEMMEEGEIGAWRGEWLEGSQGREKYRWERTRAFSARLPHFHHIWSYHGSSRRRSSLGRPCGSAGRRTAGIELALAPYSIVNNTRPSIAVIFCLAFFCLSQTCIKS
jgi:hypothetical protein